MESAEQRGEAGDNDDNGPDRQCGFEQLRVPVDYAALRPPCNAQIRRRKKRPPRRLERVAVR